MDSALFFTGDHTNTTIHTNSDQDTAQYQLLNFNNISYRRRIIAASAWFSLLSGIFNLLLIIESNKWITSQFDELKQENKNLQIALTSILFFLSVPVIVSAYKTAKIIGWQVYKKIGSSIQLQNMYHTVQCFALWLKIDIYFEIVLLICTAIATKRLAFQIICIVMVLLVSLSLIFSRIAITKESNWMLFIFLFLQIMLLACNVYSLIGLFEYSTADLWFTGIIYEFASIICIIITVYLAIKCQINFGKGLKPYVFWVPFQGTKRFIEEPPHHAIEAGLLGIKRNEDRMPIDDEDDEYYYNDSSITETKKTYMMNHDDIPRRSLERVDNVPFNVKMERYAGNTKLDSIKLRANSTVQPIRVAMKPIPKDTNTNTTTAFITTTVNSSNKPWRSDFASPTPDTGSVSSSTVIESGAATTTNSSSNSTIEPTVMGRVMQPVANSAIVPDGLPLTTTVTTTTVISTMRP
ncbi:hypothetical protein MUCCIDRAFT_163257 [Mucor lusitanicus CBS 277.49]|uniref:Uncharacterized protein n=1 Tax=Mucor lusitanicus CBS 277.49 TaxID=747725 RepID=A0A162TD76_MUCCL|nr:hypothetical protein MUCCIDRAFT_163257 [Mucor lusitanicus CBS 277.49]